ncbi:hypothetical protein JOQ06_027994 [Pogonophryne albipinna]|uniref:Uncharacterized protein n=1 Tax=Pogonophryne albipinna TaxID=1090488 RepID=A0AAD6A835_9TELE|nr:hypothetical protein JOQ06_027994 [Pogonophryne albipinna]
MVHWTLALTHTLGPLQHNPDVVCRYTHMFLSLRGSDISIIEGKVSHILKPCQPMTCSPRGRWALTLRDINEKATRSLKTLHHDG